MFYLISFLFQRLCFLLSCSHDSLQFLIYFIILIFLFFNYLAFLFILLLLSFYF